MFLMQIDGGFSLIMSELLIILSRAAGGQLLVLLKIIRDFIKSYTISFFSIFLFRSIIIQSTPLCFFHVPQALDKAAFCHISQVCSDLK